MNFSLIELYAAGSTAAYVACNRKIAGLIETAENSETPKPVKPHDLSMADDDIVCRVVQAKIKDSEKAAKAIQTLTESGDWKQINENYQLAERLGNECVAYLPVLQEHDYKPYETDLLGECHRSRRVDNVYNTSLRIFNLTKGVVFPNGLDFAKQHYSEKFHPTSITFFHFPFIRGSNKKSFFGNEGQLQYLSKMALRASEWVNLA